METAIRHPKYQ